MGTKATKHWRTVLALTIAATILGSVPAAANGIFGGKSISLELKDAALENVLVGLSQATEMVFAVEPEVAARGFLDQKIDASFESVPWDRVVDEVLNAAGLSWTVESKVVWIHLPGFELQGDRAFTGEPIKLRLSDADIHAVLETFARFTGFTIELEPEIEAQVTIKVEQMPWDQVLDLILRINGLGSIQDDDRIAVYRETEATGMQLF